MAWSLASLKAVPRRSPSATRAAPGPASIAAAPRQVVLCMAMPWGGMAALVAADVVGVERRTTRATVVGFVDKWNMKRGHECVTQLLTGFGDARIYTRNLCHDAPWHIGDTAEVVARQLRFTRTIVVSTHGTIFRGAYSILPDS